MLRSVLVANRGEIAVRIMRTARALGMRTIAVYSDADRDALHVAAADEAVRLGPAPARESYLDLDALIAAARRTGAESIHPGYGFLAENADLAAACAATGIRFVGPSAEAIRIMGLKDAARQRMQVAGVPVVPGAEGDEVLTDAQAAAERVGFPLLIKAVAGGGGKGMRVVRAMAEFPSALEAVRREARAAFGDERVLLERWLERARHVEVQVFADAHGNVVHLFDRDCSVQRRQQKVLEEAPAPELPSDLRERMAAAAVAAARAVGYVGAGTIEFLVAGGEFHFLEMNTRLQVEHPVTELVTGEDLVAWQFRVAAGETLPLEQGAIAAEGHAIEVRLYAEDPASGYLPATGRLERLVLPSDVPGVRVDTGVRQGDVVSPHYDPMIAKIAAHGGDRATALDRLARALEATRVHGVRTNLELLRRLVAHAGIRGGATHTAWLEIEGAALTQPVAAVPDARELAAAAVTVVLLRRRRARDVFDALGAWRLNAASGERVTLETGEQRWRISVTAAAESWVVSMSDAEPLRVWARLEDDRLDVELDGVRRRWDVVATNTELTLMNGAGTRSYRLGDVLSAALHRAEPVAGSLLAPMPGQVVSVAVAAGDSVAEGDVLMVLEAMKMEHSIRAPHAGTVSELHFGVGDRVEEGALLAAIEVVD